MPNSQSNVRFPSVKAANGTLQNFDQEHKRGLANGSFLEDLKLGGKKQRPSLDPTRQPHNLGDSDHLKTTVSFRQSGIEVIRNSVGGGVPSSAEHSNLIKSYTLRKGESLKNPSAKLVSMSHRSDLNPHL